MCQPFRSRDERAGHYRWTGHYGWGLGSYIAINGVLVPSLGSHHIENVNTVGADLRRQLVELPRSLRNTIWRVKFGKLPARGANTLIQEPGADESLRIVSPQAIVWERPHYGGKLLSAPLTAADGWAPFTLGANDELQIRLFYSYYTEYRPAQEWLVKVVATALDTAAP